MGCQNSFAFCYHFDSKWFILENICFIFAITTHCGKIHFLFKNSISMDSAPTLDLNFAQKMEFLEVDFLNKKLSFASVCTTTKYVKCILWPLFVLFQCSSRVDLVPKIGVITFRRRQLFRQCCWQLRYFSSNKSSNILKKMMSYSRIMLTLFFGTWNVF